MKPARIILLVVAIVAGGLAAYLATRGNNAPQQVVQQAKVEVTRAKVLVASQPIGVGERLGPGVLEWQDWPDSAVRPEYVTASAMPDAPSQLEATIARFEIFPGEPILQSKLVRSDQGYLSAVLPKGMRAVSFPVVASSSAGGFVVPNDHVDVLKTVTQGGIRQTETVLENVKVLAIGLKLGEKGGTTGGPEGDTTPTDNAFKNSTIATLELTPRQAEAVIAASSDGQLTLVLRSVADFGQTSDSPARQGQTVRMIKFGQQSAVIPSGGVAADTQQTTNTPVETSAEQILDTAISGPEQTEPPPPSVTVQ